MNCLEYFRLHFPNYDLTADSGAGDGTCEADILEEMPLDSGCGLECKNAIDAAVLLSNSIVMAYGPEGSGHPTGQEIFPAVINAAVECCSCFIRG